MLSDALGLGLLIRGGFCGDLGLGFGSLAFLLAFYLGILSSIPGFKDLEECLISYVRIMPWLLLRREGIQREGILTSLSSSSSSNWRRRAAVTGGDEGGVLESLSSSSGVKSGQLKCSPGR